MKMEESSLKGQKTLWEKEKLLINSNFSFSQSVFKRLVSEGASKGVVVWEWVKEKVNAQTDGPTHRPTHGRTTGHDISSLAYGQWS